MAAKDTSRFRFEDGGFLILVLIVTIAFGFVIKPFFGAILWSLVLALLFGPMNRRLLVLHPGRRNGMALLTLTTIILMVILPAIMLGALLIQEFVEAYNRFQTGAIDLQAMFDSAFRALPRWLADWLRTNGWADFSTVRDSVGKGLAGSFRTFAGQALLVGQSTLDLLLMLSIMLYLTFFLLRDGDELAARVIQAIPLDPERRDAVVQNFVVVIRATIKGSLVVAMVQGLIGGIVFWALGIEGALLWGVLMGIFSLIPAVGTGLVWVPVSIYLLATGAMVPALILIFCGLFVIGMVDNILRPILVGRDTRMPDYVVLISTLGGLQVFGFNGFVIGPVVAALFIGTWNIFTASRLGDSAAETAPTARAKRNSPKSPGGQSS